MSKNARKKVQPSAPDPALIVEHDDPYAEYADREWDFYFLPQAEPEEVSEKALHNLMKEWRHGRASKTIGQVLGDAYYAIFSVGILGAMVVNLLMNSQANAAGCSTVNCQAARTLLPWVLLFGFATLTLSVARIFGPVLASAAEGFWLMDAPISRTRLLRGRLLSAWLLAFGIAGAAGALLTMLSGASAVSVVAWALAMGSTSASLIAFGAFEQVRERTIFVRALQAVFSLAAAVAVVVMVLTSAGRMELPQIPGGWYLPAGIAAVMFVSTLIWNALVMGRLNDIRRARLVSGGSLVSGMQGAMFALDLGLARDILVERDAVARGFVRPTKGRGTGPSALIWRDVQRVIRFPKPLLGLVAAILVPYGVDALGLAVVMPLLASLALVAALVPFLGSLRVLSRTGGLARTFPFSTSQIRDATMVVPGVLALAWGIAVLPAIAGLQAALGLDVPQLIGIAVAMAAAGLLGAVRWQTAKQPDFNTPMVATNAGAMPPTLIFNLFRGLDVCAAVTAPIMLGAPWYWSVGIAAVIYLFMRSGFNTQEMQAEAEDQKRQLEAEKAKRAEKKVVPRPSARR